MPAQSAAQEDSPLAVTPAVRPRMPWRVVAVAPLSGLRLHVRFMDGLEGVVDMSGLVPSRRAGIFAALSDPALFAQARVEYGAVTWPGGIDLAPDAMHAEIQKNGEWRL